MISQLFVSIHVHTYLYNYFNGIQRNAYIEDTPVLNRLIFVPRCPQRSSTVLLSCSTRNLLMLEL